MSEKQLLLRVRVDDPFHILGVCIYLNEHEYLIPNLYFLGKLNLRGFIQQASLNKWIDVTPDDRMVHIECGNESKEEVKARGNEFYHQIVFDNTNELLSYLKDNNCI